MTICPVALAIGCKKCPIFTVCPAKGIIGDQAPAAESEAEAPAKRKPAKRKSRR